MSQETMEEQYSLGAIPDRPDARDFQFSTLVDIPPADKAKLVRTTDRKNYSMVGPDFRINQGNEGTCVGHGDTNMLLAGTSTHPDYPDFQTTELAHQFARRLYFETTGDSTYKQGAYPRDACAKLLEWGLIESYWKIQQVEDIITALLTFGPVGMAVPWYESMYSPIPKFGNHYVKVNLDSEHVGYHWIVATGIDLSPDAGMPYFRWQNSWGPGFGTNGTARITIENFRRINIWDNWTFKEKSF